MTTKTLNGGGALTPSDLIKLATSYLTPKIIADTQIRRVGTHEGAELVGRKPKASVNYAGLIFPYFWPGESRPREYRLRRDEPELEAQSDGTAKEKNKYLSPPGKGNLLYFAPATDAALLADSSVPMTITEGEKKTLALSRYYAERSEKRMVIGLSGVWNWRGTVGKQADAKGQRRDVKGVIPDVERGNWQNARRLLATYLDSDPGKRVLCVTKQGWHRGSYILPDEAIGEESAEPVYLQTFSTDCLFRQRGTADEWRDNVGRSCAGKSRLMLAVSVAFSAALIEPLQGESGGWHFTGGSSLGKSTALFVAGSAWKPPPTKGRG